MIELTVFLTLVALYLYFNRGEPIEPEVLGATLLMAVYLAIYLYVPPALTMSSRHIGQVFGYVPAVSFGAILFPELNSRFPVRATRLLGWVGLVVILLILCFLKLFVW
ncbi:hypothetical protein [Marinobacter sp.]|uniref:hypothetical protein n=1 Tax=Marinobacter sp. TaxID=50741 RepID=UPI0019BAB153|nr:hypothetical protein [Marinobacter sp.]MBC7192062.1 hypothetical protein [Marinobacter sp.]